ncbi:uncharacterized protein LOC102705720 [Oryza brachyantha]|uniref:Uncharacterized protein n=1 Tax=Oryza brachyantha TaxID=4533 RepID=J3M8A6_ORYBR|nr:uncharacterized protein LOC102705720 [Oryza brachyantha]
MGRRMGRRLGDIIALLALAFILLFPVLVSSVPTSRSLHLSSQQQHPSSLNLSADETVAVARGFTGRQAARMDVEVNDYPSPGANRRHNPPRGPGRA